MIVMKFGGTSVGDPQRIREVCGLVRGRVDRRPLVVTSAHSGMTDLLIEAAHNALDGKPDASRIEERQLGILRDLGLDKCLVRTLLGLLGDLLQGISLVEELTPRALDHVQSFGERMSARTLAAALRADGVRATAMDSFDLGLRTDNRYGAATPDPESYHEIARRWREIDADVVVTTGFIAQSHDGHITTLGRGGSDYSATIFGSAIGAKEVEIWTDVDGVMTADPSIVPQAQSLPELSFNEASELAWYGARVLHPSTILPAVADGIPVRVLNTLKPDNPGTVIVGRPANEQAAIVKSIVYKENLTLVNIVSSRMLMSHNFLAHVFGLFEKHEIAVNMVATSEVTVSLTTDAPVDRVRPIADEMAAYGTTEIKDDHAIVCIVGEGMAGVRGTAARACVALAGAGVNIQMISQGTREINIAVLVGNEDIAPAVRALHAEFFAEAH